MRCQAYQFLSRLFLFGLTEDSLTVIRGVPELAKQLPDHFDVDEAAADHQHLFGFNVFPYESVFLDPSGRFGGDLSAAVVSDYERAGYKFDPAAGGPDHIGHGLALLARLCQEEAEAIDLGQIPLSQQNKELHRRFLERHLLRWLPPLVLAIRQQNHSFYSALATMTLETVQKFRSDLVVPTKIDFSLPMPPALLEDDKTNLGEIVTYLLTPVNSGIYLSRDDIGRLANRGSVPRGFGERRNMLTDLLRSAANYGHLDQVLAALQDLVANWESLYLQMDSSAGRYPEAIVWASQASRTTAMLSEIRARASALE